MQRGGPSTGLPTKTEQADLLQAMCGRNGECPLPVVAARSPADCFDVVPGGLADRHPLHDAGDRAQRRLHRQRLRAVADSRRRRSLAPIEVKHPGAHGRTATRFMPYARDERLARPWAIAGHAGPDAPHRRPGKAGHHRQRQLRAGEPRAHGQPAGRARSPASPTTFRRKK